MTMSSLRLNAGFAGTVAATLALLIVQLHVDGQAMLAAPAFA